MWVIGDFNDDLNTSITPEHASPYANFVNDATHYIFPTKALTDAGIASTTSDPGAIDHHLNSNEANATYVPGSVEVLRFDQFIPNYAPTTSDHFPVLSRYTFGSGSGGTPPRVTVVAPNGGESLVGGSVQNITWTSTNVANVRIEYTLDGGANWAVIVSDLANTGSYAWTLPATSTSAARMRVSDMATTATDQSDVTFTITAPGAPAQVIVNEIRANEPGGNTAGEFVELVNVGGTAANIGGWTISDATSVRHTFAAGTTLNPGKAIVVFGGASPIPAGLSNAVAASSGGLSLNNGGDTVTLRDGAGAVKDSFSYTTALSGTDGVSMNRSPDGTAAGAFVLHTSISSAQSSPGARASGAPW